MNSKQFLETMANMVPQFDAEIMETIRPESSWVGTVSYGRLKDNYSIVLEKVRKLSEGLAYVPTESESCFKSHFISTPKSSVDVFGQWA